MFRIGRYRFRPRLGPSLMSAAGCALFFGLALWQAQRALDKQALQAEIERLRAMPALDWPTAAPPQPYRRVQARGRLLAEAEILLDNRVHQGRAGYHVITPLEVAGHDRLLLVNRGWVPLGRDRSERPETPAPAGQVLLSGVLAQPAGRPFGLSADKAREYSSGDVWPYLDRALLADRLGRPVSELELRLDPDNEAGFVRDWPRVDTKVGMHVGYALQWLAFGLIVLATYVYVSTRREPTAA